ncbi:CaiB/BaiF CoA transferase family protein [Xanthobacter pseudotagetidis]|uniref:CaiB/BaiF CoA transferase family protein n=1 Tax=Xanthobacter pseudotagetidis TaxID=3119911 RepID=UPI00372C11C7
MMGATLATPTAMGDADAVSGLAGALDGLRVLDFSQIGAGPTCSMYLADLGADVVKVEPPGGDVGRALAPPWYGSEAAIFVAFNRGKRSLCLDLKAEEGRCAARRLALRADVVVESFRPGVMARLGLGYGALAAERPGLVYCSVSGFGQTGPFAAHAGVDGIVQAASGLMSLIGGPDDAPSKVQAPIVDVTTGFIATIAVLGAILRRQRTDLGAHLDVSLFGSALALQQSALTQYFAEGRPPERIGSAAPYSAPNEAFRTEDGWIMVAAYLGDRWSRLCAILGRPELAEDARFATSPARLAHRAEMQRELNAAFVRRSTAAWVLELERADILCSPVASFDDLAVHPQARHMGAFGTVGGADGQTYHLPASPFGIRGPVPHLPRLGEHSRAVLAEAGFAEQAISDLMRAGIAREP